MGSPVEMQQLRRHTRIPFSGHNVDLPGAQKFGVPAAIVTDPTSLGGVLRLMRFIAACDEAGIDVWCYSGDSGIMSTA